MSDNNFENLWQSLARLDAVEAIALGGSRASGAADANSDYDLYVYLKENVEPSHRQKILEQWCKYMEINNQFWETEDDCTLNNGIDIDILYRNLDDIAGIIAQVKGGLAYNGYTTCMWDNVARHKILYDETGRLQALQESLQMPLPEKLQANIIAKNRRLLSGSLASYDGQIRKAIKRQDLPSISHRTAAFLESYFDILFALNGMYHPGEKRMVEALKNAPLLPEDFEKNLKQLFASQYHDAETFLTTLETIIANLDALLACSRQDQSLDSSGQQKK